jgi:predicted enzyme related to lactoylglutathione lyase
MAFAPTHPVVWVEIPVTDLDAACRFYETVFGFTLTRRDDGPNPMADIAAADAGGVSGHLYPGKPAAGGGPTIHLHVQGRLEDAARRVEGAGGTMLPMPPVAIPPGRFQYATDPDGNSLGLFEPAGG